ncbi:HAD family hydrolase [Alkalihalobacillus sp. AL-G]|uniref:HAD family hydrolase n=1 Tax=Alkalihalobacillus sp. AL-G TaxID=2926399 RepID=UPI00272A6F18|nr:HAD family hydrolase [Alkalihalobacillus sp. AL-G]WLD95422.1 HAD family hydrolase [Alkalihalobacillus sp. AL-G]
MNRWKRVFFDLDNTLFDYERAFELASKQTFSQWSAAEKNGVHVDQWFNLFKEACDRLWPDYENGHLSRKSYQALRFQQSLQTFHIEVSQNIALWFEHQFKKQIPDFIDLYDGVELLLEFLCAHNIELGIISNGDYHLQLKKMNRLSIFKWIPSENIYVTDESGKVKPSSSMFDLVIQNRSGNPSESLFVGDSWDLDVVGAISAGWNALHLNTSGVPPSTDHEPFHSAATFKEIYERRNVLFLMDDQ